MPPFAIVLLTFVFTTGFVYVGIEARMRQRRQLRARLDHITGRFRAEDLRLPASPDTAERPDVLPTVTRWLGGSEWEPRLRRAMIQADLRLRPAEWIALLLVSMFSLAFLGLLTTHEPGTGLLLGIAGAALPSLWLTQRQEVRRRRFNAQIPDMLMLLTASLRAGHSFTQAMQMVASEMPRPLADEFAWAVGEIGLGVSAEIALGRMVERVRSLDMDLIATAILIQLPVGGNLAEVLDAIAGTLRERVRIQGEVQTLTAEGKLSGVVLIALPPLLALLLHLRNPDYFQPLLQNAVGRWLIIGAAAGQVIGGLIIKRMVTLDI